jgi:cytochrome c-type biogenesis protein CcmH/NrfG
MRKSYDQGRMSEALSMAKQADSPEHQKDPEYLKLYATILLETEGPDSQIVGLLSKAHLLAPNHTEIMDYLELAEARLTLSHTPGSDGETRLKALLRRSPENVHALFFLGTHLYWTQNEQMQSMKMLERVVRLRPAFLRAWGCLGMIYKKLGNQPLASRAFKTCMTLETDSEMKKFFKEQAGG